MQTLVVTGAAGFIGGYIVREALASGYKVIGIDNLSKYGNVDGKFIKDKNFNLIRGLEARAEKYGMTPLPKQEGEN